MTPEDWTRAALDTIAEQGIGHVSVERLAARLGTTKGSFYWHFADRPALLEAALARWELVFTDRILERLGEIEDPRLRFRTLFETIFQDHPGVMIDAALLADSRDPLVSPVLERVARKRLAFVERIFVQLGRRPAKDPALLACTAYIGLAQLRRATPGLTPSSRRVRGYVDHVVATLLDD